MQNRVITGLTAIASLLSLIVLLTLISTAATAQATSPAASPYYARTNTFSVFGAYSGDSSHILLGDAENRMLLDFGVAYGRRLVVNLLFPKGLKGFVRERHGILLPRGRNFSDFADHYALPKTACAMFTTLFTTLPARMASSFAFNTAMAL